MSSLANHVLEKDVQVKLDNCRIALRTGVENMFKNTHFETTSLEIEKRQKTHTPAFGFSTMIQLAPPKKKNSLPGIPVASLLRIFPHFLKAIL